MKTLLIACVILTGCARATVNSPSNVGDPCEDQVLECVKSFDNPDQDTAFCNGRGNKNCSRQEWANLCNDYWLQCEKNR
jgi:hypothetical protein